MTTGPKSIGIIYDTIVRKDTAGTYYYKAAKKIGHDTTHYEIGETIGKHDIYIHIDDDFNYKNNTPKEKSAYVIIDGHRLWNTGATHPTIKTEKTPFWRIIKAWDFKKVFVSQKHIAQALSQFNMDAEHLPMAGDEETWKKITNTKKKYDWCHVGRIYEEKKPVIEALIEKYPNCYVGTTTPNEANKIINESKIAINISFNKDIPMRVFEVLLTGTHLLTPHDEALKEIITTDYPLHTYPFHPSPFNKESLKNMVEYLLENEEKREKKSEKERINALKNHTYKNRINTIIQKTIGE